MRIQRISEDEFKGMQSKVRGAHRAEATAGSTSGGKRRAALDVAKQPGHRQLDKLPPSLYKSKWEESFAYDLVLQQRTNLIRHWGYEVMTLKLGKKKYHRPDFTIWHLDGSIEQAAVKGYHKNLRDSLTIIKWACKEHPWFRFSINRRDQQGWLKEAVMI